MPTQNAEPIDTDSPQMAYRHYGYVSLDVDVYYGNGSEHATFADDLKAAQWASEALLRALRKCGIRNHERAEVVFTRR